MNKNDYAQQGDVIIEPFKIPEGLIQASEPDILQHGEATGHAHRLHGQGYELYETPDRQTKYLRLVEPTALRHEEHQEILLPPGEYRIGIVREYDHFAEEARRVAD